MTKLYYSPTSCGAASFISMVAAGLQIEVEQVFLNCHRTTTDADFYIINPKGNVPCLVLDDGTIFNENAAVLQYIADMNPNSVAPAYGTVDRYLLVNALGYLSSELHPAFRDIFHLPDSSSLKSDKLQTLETKLDYVQKHLLKEKNFLVGDKFSIADAYLYVMLRWDTKAGLDLGPFPGLLAYRAHIGELQVVVEAKQKMESLVPTRG